jgi:exodeoxyribonuclease VII small subunit
MSLTVESNTDSDLPESVPAATPSFEEAIRDLQQIVSELEGGSITLDASLKRFEQGIGLLRQCYQFLDRTEQRIEQLVSLDAAGNCTLVPFDATATADKPVKAAPAKSTARKPPKVKEQAEPAAAVEPPDEPELPGKLLF